ncbi:sugar phosphate isomerase/epimerase family protein [uncultured Amnibacterium sp.]|uniref:sugar phosphate isomerase/epimerase family protein n=1 Tax=uncultured Amnibacterium sp. TaxID=1631851 RepID=UPI0035CB0A1C
MTDQLASPPTARSAVSAPSLSFGTWAFAFGPFAGDPWDFPRICRWAAAAGYDGVEINGFRPHPHDRDVVLPEDVAAMRTLLAENGLSVSGFAPDLTTTPPALSSERHYLKRIDSCLDFCERIGIPLLRVDTVSAPGPVDETRFAHLVSTWRRAADRSADRGVQLIWEFEPGFWINRPSDVLRLLDEIDHPNFRVLFDTSHAYTGAVAGGRQGPEPEILPGGVVEYAQMLRDHVGHLHLIDSVGVLHDDETSEHLPFGAGAVDFPAVLDALGCAASALPWWTVDFCFWPEVDRDGRDAVPFVRGLRDGLAVRGVR